MRSEKEIKRMGYCAICDYSAKRNGKELICNWNVADKMVCREIVNCGFFPPDICFSETK